MSQRALADAAGVHYVTIANLERGKALVPHVRTISGLARALGFTVPDLRRSLLGRP